MSVHPKAAEAAQRAEEKRKQREHRKKQRDELAAIAVAAGLKFFHREPRDYSDGQHGLTVAYRVLRRNVIEIATAICHPNDNFSKKEGQAVATSGFIEGNTVLLHVASDIFHSPKAFIEHTFRH